MKSDERGFSTPLALTVIFSLSIIIISYAMFVASGERKIISYQNFINEKKEVEKIIKEISKSIQYLKYENIDTDDSVVINQIKTDFNKYNLSIEDVSSFVNVNFLKKEIIESEPFTIYLNKYDCKTSDYGWINPKYADSEIIESIKKDFSKNDKLIFFNKFPFYNIFKMDSELLLAVFQYFKIDEPEEKIAKIYGLNDYDINKKEIAKILNVNENSGIFDFISTKTVFWKCTFETNFFNVQIVYGLIPDPVKEEEILEYRIIERKIMQKGGELC